MSGPVSISQISMRSLAEQSFLAATIGEKRRPVRTATAGMNILVLGVGVEGSVL